MPKALISVWDKTNIVDVARELSKAGYKLMSTGGTAEFLSRNGVEVVPTSMVTSFDRLLGGRVKSLHPYIHAAILVKRDDPMQMKELAELGIEPIDVVIVNFYPFVNVIRSEKDIDELVEFIDIGGPAMLRAAAKNFKHVVALCDVSDYEWVLQKIKTHCLSIEDRMKLAAKAFQYSAWYDTMIAQYFSRIAGELFPKYFVLSYEKVCELRYGENPHQQAALYRELVPRGTVEARQLHGKELSFNNYLDAEATLSILKDFEEPCCVVVKHTNPCAVACAQSVAEAFERARDADPISIFGGIVGFNYPVDGQTARKLSEIFLEIILAPAFSDEALEILRKKKNLRLLQIDLNRTAESWDLRKISGGLLIQTPDVIEFKELKVVSERQPSEAELKDLIFAWKVVKHVKSNAIVLAKDSAVLAIGAGQPNRLWPTEHCIRQAGEKAKGAVLASDAFFPFPDAVELAGKAGVTAIIQPGGSVRDQEVIETANRYNMAMVFTGIRHFKH